MSSEQDFEDFAKKYPELMSKSRQDSYIGVGKGWLHILDTLFQLLCKDLENAKSLYKYAIENPEAKTREPIEVLGARVEDELQKLPTIIQIKEKFGGLRFYVTKATPEQENFIRFAEHMSNHVCEVCGAPGKHSNRGWIKTLCPIHEKDVSEGRDPWFESEDEMDDED